MTHWYSPPDYPHMINVTDHVNCCGTSYKQEHMENTPVIYDHTESPMSVMPTSSNDRKATPLASGVLDYFPNALAAVARLSKAGNDKHNPGQELHWSRDKSGDHADTIMRHLVDRGTVDPEDGMLHDIKVAWRALALLEEELIRRGATPGRNARTERKTLGAFREDEV